MTTVV